MSVKTTLNGTRDLGIDPKFRPYIGQRVEILRRLKNGLLEIVADDGTVLHVAKYNLG